ncbi:MAG: carboxypeptidase regulatory-like domain-containing protein [Acidobacteriaceae bacterium]
MEFRRFIAILSVAGMLLFAAAVSRAQTVTGSIGGTVTDSTGAVVPNAAVTARNVATGVQATTRSNQSGVYNFQFLPIGSYNVIVNASGFAKTTAGPLRLEIDQIAKIDIKLQVGQASTTVKVNAEGAVLQTQSSTLATTVTANTIENLPLSGNNFQVAAVFVPGAVLPRFDMEGGANGFERNTNPATLPSFNGNRQQGNNYIMDGVEINEPTNNLIGYNPAPQAIQEMRTVTGNADAEYGDVSGGEILLVTKGGTNQFHGSAYEYYENQALTANLWSNNYNGLARGVFHQNIFGVTFGGPVIRNKLFFFVDYEGVRNNSSGTGTASVATALMRTGDFSELLTTPGVSPLQLYNLQPSATNPTGGWAAATPYNNNQIPINNPVAAYLFSHPDIYPMPNFKPRANTVDSNNYHASTAGVIKNNQGDIRVDWAPDSRDTFWFRYSDGDALDYSPKVVLAIQFPTGNDYPFHSGVVNWVHTFSPSLVNQARGGFTRVQWFNGIPTDPTGKFGMSGNQTVGIPAPQAFPGFSLVNLSTAESNVGSAAVVQNFLDNIFNYGDDLVWQHGNHTTKFGVQVVRYQQNNYYAGNYGALGQFIYDGTYTTNGTSAAGGYGFADFVVDQADISEVGGVAGPVGQREYHDAFYVQDDWKVLPNLTLNLGVRYGYDQPMYEVNNKEVNVDISKAGSCTAANDTSNPCLMFAGQNGNSRALYEPFHGGVMPRIGFAFQAYPRLVVRGGYGITDYLEGTGANLRPTMNPPFFSQFVNAPATPGTTSPGNPLSISNGFSNGTQQAITQYDAWDTHLKPAMVQQFNLTTEYLINNHTTVQVGYVGEVGQHLIVPASADQWTQPYTGSTAHIPPSIVPFYNLVGPNGRVVVTMSAAMENYNAMQATLRHRQSGGLEYTLNYTLSKSMTNNPGFFGISGVDGASAYWQNYYNPRADYGPSGFDVRHTINGTAVWQLPFGVGRRFGGNWNRATDEVLGGWRLSGDVILHTGFPINMTGSIRSNVHARTGRASQFRKMKIVHRSVRHWFGTDPSSNPCSSTSTPDNGICAFGSPAPGQFGNVPPNNGPRAPGYRIIDMSLFKSFRTFEDQNLTFRVDAFNAFNMASYAAPAYVSTANAISPNTFASNPDASAEGEITSTLSPARQFQLSLIYKF